MTVDGGEPRWLKIARGELGVKEAPGFANNPKVQRYYQEAGAGKMPDSVPWCAAFVGAMLKRAGSRGTNLLAARSYLQWGMKLDIPRLGCIVVFKRGTSPWQGHVAFFLRDNGKTVRVLGGNQQDAVNMTSYPKAAVLGYRWPAAYSI
jgi:uncharacterized protein (TIGR02594 family)